MKLTKQILSIILCITLIIGLIPITAEAATPVKLSKKSVTLNIVKSNNKTTYGKSTIKVKKSKGIKVVKMTYKSKNKKIATVSKKGVVTAKKKGDTTITVTVKYQKKVKKKWKTYTKKLTYKVKVKIVDKRTTTTEKTTEQKTEVSTETSTEAKTEATTETSVTTEKPTEAPASTEATTERPASTEATTERSTEEASTEASTEATTEETTTEVPNIPSLPSIDTTDYDYAVVVGDMNYGITYRIIPSTTQAGAYDWYNLDTGDFVYTYEIPVLDEIVLINDVEYGKVHHSEATCLDSGVDLYYDLRTGDYYVQTIPALDHKVSDIWHADVSDDGETGTIYKTCQRCNAPFDEISVAFSEDAYFYTEWYQEPSETEDGIRYVYKGVDVYGMTEEEKAEKYVKYDVVFDDGTTDTFYGNWVDQHGVVTENEEDASHFAVYAKSTAVKVGELYYPKYEVVEINLGDTDGDGVNETTKVYGYYDDEMASEVYKLLNEYRVEQGLAELGTSDYINGLAKKRAPEEFYTHRYNEENGGNVYESHQRPNFTDCQTIDGDNTKYTYGENTIDFSIVPDYLIGGIIQGSDYSAQHIMDMFKSSSGHNANMINPDYGGVGISIFVGYPQNEDGTFRNYKEALIVQSFMQ